MQKLGISNLGYFVKARFGEEVYKLQNPVCLALGCSFVGLQWSLENGYGKLQFKGFIAFALELAECVK